MYTSIDAQERARGVHMEDTHAMSARSTPEGRIMCDLVHEWLLFYHADCAASVMAAELAMVWVCIIAITTSRCITLCSLLLLLLACSEQG